MGSPVVGGASEDSPTPMFYAGHLLPFVHTYEGAHRSAPHGCQGTKYKALGLLQNLLLPSSAFPQVLTVQTIQINELLLVALPGELTVEMVALAIHGGFELLDAVVIPTGLRQTLVRPA
jgi:hypothetical protein